MPITSPCDSVTVSEGKDQRKGLNRLFSAMLQVGGSGSHTLPGHVIRKWMVNTTLARGHPAQTRCTARNFSDFLYDSSMLNKTVHYYF
jgi:hypothetical protein